MTTAAPSRTEVMREQWESGLSFRDIGKLHGISGQRVAQLTGKLGRRLRPAHQKIREERTAAYERIMAGNSTLKEEAQNLGMKPNRLRSYLSDRGMKIPSTSPEHGTWYRYSRTACRCKECKEAAREERRKRVARGPKVHGTQSAYANYGCRCAPCRAAGSKANRDTRLKRQRRERAAARRRAEV